MIEQLVNEFSSKCDYVDARVHELKKELIILENSETNNIFLNNKTYGVRALYKGGWGFCYSNDFTDARSVFNKALRIAKLSSTGKRVDFISPVKTIDYKKIKYKIDPFNVEPVDKIKMLQGYEQLLTKDAKIKNTYLSIDCSREDRIVYAPGISIRQEFTNNFLRVNATAREGDVIQSVYHRHSELGGYECINKIRPSVITKTLIERVNRQLHAKAPKPGKAVVVCDPQMTGLFFHEAVGHACEADAVINNSSVFKGKRGELIGSEEINLFNDPTINERGFYWYDDEGVKARETPLIVGGVLAGYLHSIKTANELSENPTGNGRCMGAEYNPIPRMSNMILKQGKWSPDELITEAKNGYLVKGFTGGVVDPISGQFSFGASECFRIVNGQVTEPLRDVALGSSILDALKSIKVGNDYQRSNSGGTCGKDGQGVRVGEACPSILIKDVIIGGSA
ncbi:MAG: TldD/PmbA family protein [Candidatus Nanoarchaeia archaeon]|jgi:TldD protein